MLRFAGTSNETAAIADAPEFPTQQNGVLLQRLADLMLNFGMLQQHYNVNQIIVSPPQAGRRAPPPFGVRGPVSLPGPCAQARWAEASVSTETCQSSAASLVSRA